MISKVYKTFLTKKNLSRGVQKKCKTNRNLNSSGRSFSLKAQRGTLPVKERSAIE